VDRSAVGAAVGVGETTQVVFLGNYQSEYVEHRQRQHRRLSLTCGPCAVVRIPPTIRLPARPSWKHASTAYLESDRDSAEGALLDLSRTGARLSSVYPVQPRDYLSLSLSLPFQVPSLEVILAAVRWAKGKNFGVEFIQIAEGEQRRLRDFLTTHSTPNTSP